MLISIALLVFVMAIRIDLLNREHGKRSLINWAKSNQYQITEQRCPLLQRGPFFWKSSKYQLVYRVKVLDRSGLARQGWVCCGDYWKGCIFTDKAVVIWQN
jgi:hypothetical protein